MRVRGKGGGRYTHRSNRLTTVIALCLAPVVMLMQLCVLHAISQTDKGPCPGLSCLAEKTTAEVVLPLGVCCCIYSYVRMMPGACHFGTVVPNARFAVVKTVITSSLIPTPSPHPYLHPTPHSIPAPYFGHSLITKRLHRQTTLTSETQGMKRHPL